MISEIQKELNELFAHAASLHGLERDAFPLEIYLLDGELSEVEHGDAVVSYNGALKCNAPTFLIGNFNWKRPLQQNERATCGSVQLNQRRRMPFFSTMFFGLNLFGMVSLMEL